MDIPEGRICYYASNGTFEAQCKLHKDERCTWSKVREGGSAASSSAARPAPAVSPVGALAAWLQFGASTGCCSKMEHKHPEILEWLSADTEMASAARDSVSKVMGGEEFLRIEL